MNLPRSNVVPVLTIIAGGALGALLTFSPLVLWSPSDDVPAPAPAAAPSPTPEPTTRAAARPGTITGQITEAATGRPVAAAQVYISNLELGGLSQQNGRYLLQNVPAGQQVLTVSRIGYETMQVIIEVGGNRTVEQNFVITEGNPSDYPYQFAPTRESLQQPRN